MLKARNRRQNLEGEREEDEPTNESDRLHSAETNSNSNLVPLAANEALKVNNNNGGRNAFVVQSSPGNVNEFESESQLQQMRPHISGSNINHHKLDNAAAASVQSSNDNKPLRIVRLLAPEAVQNGTRNVTIGKLLNSLLNNLFKEDKVIDLVTFRPRFFSLSLSPKNHTKTN